MEQAERLYGEGQYYEAMDKATELLTSGESTTSVLIRAERVIFMSAMRLNEGRYAHAAVKRLLQHEPGYCLEGEDVGEREQQFFGEIRAGLVGELVIKDAPADARILVDGKEVRRGPGSVSLLDGEHTIEVTCQGYESMRFVESVVPGSEREVLVVMIPAAEPQLEEEAATRPPLLPAGARTQKAKRASRKWLYYGGAAVLIGAGVALGLSMGDEGSEEENLPGPPPFPGG
jgi:hypothetical protein